MKNKIHILFIFSLIILSCNKDTAPDCFKRNGSEARETRHFDYFNTVRINHNVEVHFFQGNEFKIELVGPKNLLKKITSTVEKEEIGFEGKKTIAYNLTVNNNNSCDFVRGYKRHLQVYITAPSLLYIEHNSVFDFVFEKNINQDTIHVNCGNSGDMYVNGNYKFIGLSTHGNGFFYLSGSCTDLAVYSNGINYIHAENLIVNGYGFVSSYTQGDIILNGSSMKLLDYSIHSSGNIICKGGNPIIRNATSEQYGSGKLIRE